MIVAEVGLFWQVRNVQTKERVHDSDAVSVVEIDRRHLLPPFNYHGAFQKYLTVKVRQYFSYEDFVSKTLSSKIVEKIDELLVVAFQECEAELILEVWREIFIEFVVFLQTLHDSSNITVLDILDGIVIDIMIEILVPPCPVHTLQVRLDVVHLVLHDVLQLRHKDYLRVDALQVGEH